MRFSVASQVQREDFESGVHQFVSLFRPAFLIELPAVYQYDDSGTCSIEIGEHHSAICGGKRNRLLRGSSARER